MSDDNSDITIDTTGTSYVSSDLVERTVHNARDADGEVELAVNDENDRVSVEIRHHDDDAEITSLASLSPGETDQLADALGVERDVTVERGRPKKYYNTTMLTGGVLVGSTIGYELAAVNDAFPLGGLGVAITIVACALVVSLIDGLIRGDVLGGGL
jgi:hypothetical protein